MNKISKKQFIHIDVYSRTPPKNTNQWSAFDILKEANREEGHIGHIADPKKPEVIYGCELDEITNDLKKLDQVKTAKGKKLRKDAKVLICGVASYPFSCSEIDQKNEINLHAWELATRNFLYQKFGSRLKSIIKHNDEEYPHLHFYVMPDFGLGEMMDQVHPGMLKRKECNGDKRAKQAAMIIGLVDFQDEYFHQVSQHFGFRRISNRPKSRQKYQFWQNQKSMHIKIQQLTNKMKGLLPWKEMTIEETEKDKGKEDMIL